MTEGYSGQNKAAIKAHQKEATENSSYSLENQRINQENYQKEAASNPLKAATPLIRDINYIFLLQQFEKFWDVYPLKKSKQKAWEAFQVVNPDDELLQKIHTTLQIQIQSYQNQLTNGQWVASWKYPANWLLQHCWDDELTSTTTLEPNNAKHAGHRTKKYAFDLFSESCGDAPFEFEDESRANDIESNVVQFDSAKNQGCTH